MQKKIIILYLLLFLCECLSAQKVAYTVNMDEVTIYGKRKLSDIGVTKTVLDTFALRDNIVNSLADVLAQNSSIFIKSYGRGTLATASFRGTAPSHTQVLWNGMKLNSPMLGMVDFSLIPSYFIDDASLFHGAGSVGVAGGGLGGAITLNTKPANEQGLGVNFIQGISSFNTFDEFLRVTYGNEKFQSSTRFCYVTSDNDFKYTNYDKEKNPDGSYPVERNKNGSFKDMHILQELYYNKGDGNKFGLSAWFMDSRRGVPMLNVNYRDENKAKNQQDEKTLRVVGSWDKLRDNLKLGGKIGYSYSNMVYRYLGDRGTDELVEMIHSQSIISSGYAQFSADYSIADKWMFSGSLSGNLHAVSSKEKYEQTGYDKQRAEVSAFLSVKYHPHPRIGIGADLREESYGKNITPLIPAGFIDIVLWPRYNVVVKGSIAKNYRYPSMNDLYFLPGGNDSLRTEKGYTYDGGLEFNIQKKRFNFNGECTLYNSQIHDWILWLPTFKGFWSPVNVKKVHSYGIELKGKLWVQLSKDWWLNLNANWARTRSLNYGDKMSWTDESIGKQLVYVPEYSSAFTGILGWKGFVFTYKYHYYSERFTTSSNETTTKVGRLDSYYMSDISLEKSFYTQAANLSLKLSVYNLFDEEYVSVLSRPMAGRNYGLFVGITPRWWKK